MRLRAPAKVNWALNVTGVRENGYHELESVMQQITLCDDVEIDLETGEDGAVLRFYGTVGQGEYPLFTYSFEMPAEDGFRVGSLDRGGETVGVYLTIYDLPEGDWTEGEESLFGALRDQAYSVLNRLSEEPDFRPLDGEEE